MKKNHTIALLAAGVVLAGMTAQADLVLGIDTTAKTFAFTGSTSGTPTHEWILWNTLTDDGTQLANEEYLTLTSYNVTTTDMTSGRIRLMDASGEIANEVRLIFSDSEYRTITGSGAVQSYASLSAIAMPQFEGLIGSSLPMTYGSGFSDIAIEAVPEPATAGLLGISVGALWLFRRLKKAANYYRT